MRLLEAPPQLFDKPAGSVLFQPNKEGLQVFIRESKENLVRFPRPCAVDVRLPTWDMPPVIPVAFLMYVKQTDRHAYMTWIDGVSLPGVQVLTKMSMTREIRIHFISDQNERTAHAPNVLRPMAKELLGRISKQQGQWSAESLEAAQKRLYRLYPTTMSLWRSMKMDRRG